MKAYVLEDGFERDIPKELINYLSKNNIVWEWYDVRERFWPKNREETFNFFSNLPNGIELYTHHVFTDYQIFELMVELLYKITDRSFKVHIMNSSLCEYLVKYYDAYESDITPNNDLFNYNYKLRLSFKTDMNTKFEQVMRQHELYHISSYGNKKTHLYSIDQIREIYNQRGY